MPIEKKLEPKKTKIGVQTAKNPVTGEVTEFEVLYGNWTLPEVKGMSLHLPDAKYTEILNDFLKSADGESYLVPSDEELEALRTDVEIDRKRQKQKAQQEKEKRQAQANMPKSNSASDEDIKRLQASIDALTSQMNGIGISVNDIKNEVIDDELDEDDEEDDDDEYEEEGFGTVQKILLAIVLVLCLGNLGLTAANIFGVFGSDSSTEEVEKTENTLVINGETYTIQSTPVELADGETKVSVYAIATTNENGTNVNKVIPLGDMNIADIENAAKESTATAESTADTEEKKEDTSTEQSSTENTESQEATE